MNYKYKLVDLEGGGFCREQRFVTLEEIKETLIEFLKASNEFEESILEASTFEIAEMFSLEIVPIKKGKNE